VRDPLTTVANEASPASRESAALNGRIVENGCGGGLRNRDQAGHATLATLVTGTRTGRGRDAVGNGTANREVGTACTAGADSEKGRALCRRERRAQQRGNRCNGHFLGETHSLISFLRVCNVAAVAQRSFVIFDESSLGRVER
jgi:hypothetical protein